MQNSADQQKDKKRRGRAVPRTVKSVPAEKRRGQVVTEVLSVALLRVKKDDTAAGERRLTRQEEKEV